MLTIQNLLATNHSKANTDRIIHTIGSDVILFEDLIKIILGKNTELARRAAWVFSEIAPDFPQICYLHWSALLTLVGQTNTHDAIKRGFFSALQQLNAPQEHLGETVQLCFEHLTNRQAAIAIRVNAMTSLVNMAQVLSELKPEIRLILEDELTFGSAGFVSRARREMRRL